MAKLSIYIENFSAYGTISEWRWSFRFIFTHKLKNDIFFHSSCNFLFISLFVTDYTLYSGCFLVNYFSWLYLNRYYYYFFFSSICVMFKYFEFSESLWKLFLRIRIRLRVDKINLSGSDWVACRFQIKLLGYTQNARAHPDYVQGWEFF